MSNTSTNNLTYNQLGKQIFDVAHISGEFLLRSGLISNEYFDKYKFESLPHLLDEITNQMLEILPPSDSYDYLAAMEMGGIPLATLLSLKTGKQIVFVRKEAKKYGTCKFAEGPDVNGKRLLVVEDVITSGGQVIISSKELRESGAIINQCVCVIDREQGGKENLTKDGTTLLPLFTMSKLKELA